MTEKKEWFEQWFDTEYYHILYGNRDEQEAQIFINNLVKKINISPDSEILEAACGKGRHAKYLNQLGLKVDAFDLSVNSIDFAKQFENKRLKFSVHDIRKVFIPNHYDYVCNFFTSFGYFHSIDENFQCFKALVDNINEKGMLVLDFFNAYIIEKNDNNSHIIEKQNLIFDTSKEIKSKRIEKTIVIKSEQKEVAKFKESVFMLYPKDFRNFCSRLGIKIIHEFGNYNLDSFCDTKSSRYILVASR